MKTLEELEKLTDDELRVMLAEIVNPGFEIAYWTYCNVTRDKDGDPQLEPIADVPNYPGDLNACHEVDTKLTLEQSTQYVNLLWPQGYAPFQAVTAAPRKRTIALILTLQKP